MEPCEKKLTLGLPLITCEPGEVRDFLPPTALVAAEAGAEVWIEADYGNRLGYLEGDYLALSPSIHVGDRATVYGCDLVLVLRPSEDRFNLLRSGATLISMLHFPTHKNRARHLKELGIEAVSLDLICDGEGERLVENMKAVAWNGLGAAFDVLEQIRPDFTRRNDEALHATIIGAGMVGKQAVEAATKFGSLERAARLMCACDRPFGVEVLTVGGSLSKDETYMRQLLSRTDLLVDASRRADPSHPVIPNTWLEELPGDSVIADLSVDPYLLDEQPQVVRGIEGIPKGDLGQYVFSPDDPAWDELPSSIPTDNRRWVVSCYSWPGIFPIECMTRYGDQIEPLLEVLIKRGGARFLRPNGGYFERALHRSSLGEWVEKL